METLAEKAAMLETKRIGRRHGEVFSASPLVTEDSWRVLGNWGTLDHQSLGPQMSFEVLAEQ